MKSANSRRVAVALFVFMLSAYVLTMGAHTYAPDDESMYYVTEAMVTRGGFDIPNPKDFPTVGGHRGLGGKIYTGSGIGQSVAMVPFYLAGRAWALGFDPRFSGYLTRFAVGFLDPLVTALLGVVLFVLGRALGFRSRTSVVLALLWGFATYAWVEAKTVYNEPLMTLLLVLAFYFLQRAQSDPQPRWFLLAGLMWSASVATKIHALIALPALLVYVGWIWWSQDRKNLTFWIRCAGAFLIPAGVVIAVGVLAYDYVRFGDVLELGYGGQPGSIPITLGLYGLLLSPGKSVFLYAPPLLLGLVAWPRFFREHRAEAIAVAVYVVSVLIFHARYENWHSDGTWGNRYLYPTLPFWILPIGGLIQRHVPSEGRDVPTERGDVPAERLYTRMLIALVVGAGVVVQLLAVPINFDVYLNQNYNQYERYYSPPDSPLVAHARLLSERVGDWWQQLTSTRAGVMLLDGWLPSDGGPGELFPRYLASRARIGINSDTNAPLHASLSLADYRPAALPRRTLNFWSDGKKLEAGLMQRGGSADLGYALTVPQPHPSRMVVQLETVGSNASGDSPMGDELGFQVKDLIVSAGNERLEFFKDLSIPPIPLAIPKAAWGWFFNPALEHFDFWWWYLYFSGLSSSSVSAIATPIAVVSLVGLILGAATLVKNL